METAFSIQQVAQLTGLSIDTLRYYERVGLIAAVNWAPNGHRRYTQDDLNWITLLIRLRETDMPLAHIVRFVQLRRQGPETLTERRLLLEEHQRHLEQRLQQLQQHRAVLQQKIVMYKEREEAFLKGEPATRPMASRCSLAPTISGIIC